MVRKSHIFSKENCSQILCQYRDLLFLETWKSTTTLSRHTSPHLASAPRNSSGTPQQITNCLSLIQARLQQLETDSELGSYVWTEPKPAPHPSENGSSCDTDEGTNMICQSYSLLISRSQPGKQCWNNEQHICLWLAQIPRVIQLSLLPFNPYTN